MSTPPNKPNRNNLDDLKKIKTEPKLSFFEATTSLTSSSSSSAAAAAAAATPKRTFVPNIGVKREKKEQEVDKHLDQQQQKNRKQFQPNVESGRGRGRRQQNFIQTKSIFEAGPAEAARKYAEKDSYSGSLDRVVGSIPRSELSKSGSSITDAKAIDKNLKQKNEQFSPDEILLDDSIKDEEGEFVKLETIKDNKDIIKRSRSMDEIDTLRTAFFSDHKNDTNEQDLFLFQMVDCLKLSELPEGKIGKLKVYKSGKIELCLGNNIKLDISLASDASFLQDVINVQVDETTETGTMTCVGHIKNKILCTPLFD